MNVGLVNEDNSINPSWKIGLVTSVFNKAITEELEYGALARLVEMGLPDDQIIRTQVPGAVEIPLAAKWLLASGCDGVVALGVVIRGETSHFDYVCSSVERGCTLLMQETGKPVSFGVLTTENRAQAEARAGGQKGHKGIEAVDVLVHMLNLKKSVNLLTDKGE